MLRFIVDVGSFLIMFLTLEIVWTNTKAAWEEKNYKNLLIYLLGGIAVFAVLIYISNVANDYLKA